MLNLLGVSRSGYYDYINRKTSNRSKTKEINKKAILKVYNDSKKIYGAPKIKFKLNELGIKISQRTVTNYMQELNIRAIYRSKWAKTTITGKTEDKLENHLRRRFNPPNPNSVWVSDITYIWTKLGFVYLTSVMDLYSRKIISWNLSDNLMVNNVVECVEKALRRRDDLKPLIIHSDRGVQYISKEYRRVLRNNITRSYSRKGNPWDNACIESFHALIKRECLDRFTINSMAHAYELIFEYIETFYNTIRIHKTLNYLTPIAFENSYAERNNKSVNSI